MHDSKNKEKGTKRGRKTVIDRETDTEKVRQRHKTTEKLIEKKQRQRNRETEKHRHEIEIERETSRHRQAEREREREREREICDHCFIA